MINSQQAIKLRLSRDASNELKEQLLAYIQLPLITKKNVEDAKKNMKKMVNATMHIPSDSLWEVFIDLESDIENKSVEHLFEARDLFFKKRKHLIQKNARRIPLTQLKIKLALLMPLLY